MVIGQRRKDGEGHMLGAAVTPHEEVRISEPVSWT